MRISPSITNFSWPGGPQRIATALDDVARRADDGGLDTLWVADHLLQCEPGTEPTEPMLEAGTVLAHLAARTTRIRVGAMVSPVFFRPPAVLVKAVTTLDVLSGGRAWFGLGTGYLQREAELTGLTMPPLAERYALLEETLQLAQRTWRGDASPFQGRHIRATEPIGSPPPVRRPPILIGGAGEKRTLPLVARYADACNLFDIPDDGATVRRKLAVLAEHCDREGRAASQIQKTVATRLGPQETPAEFAERCARFREWGLDHVITLTAGPWTSEALDRLVAARALVDAG